MVYDATNVDLQLANSLFCLHIYSRWFFSRNAQMDALEDARPRRPCRRERRQARDVRRPLLGQPDEAHEERPQVGGRDLRVRAGEPRRREHERPRRRADGGERDAENPLVQLRLARRLLACLGRQGPVVRVAV